MSSEEQEALQKVYRDALDAGHIIPGTQEHLDWKDVNPEPHIKQFPELERLTEADILSIKLSAERTQPEDTGNLRSGILYPEDKPAFVPPTSMPLSGLCDCGAPLLAVWSPSGFRCVNGHDWPSRPLVMPDPQEPVEIPVPGRDPMVHVAGECLTLFGRYMRQRCAWCGTVLLEYDLARIAVPVGQDPTPAQWPVGSQVFVDNSGVPHVSYVVETEELEPGQMKIADDSCLSNPLTLLDFR